MYVYCIQILTHSPWFLCFISISAKRVSSVIKFNLVLCHFTPFPAIEWTERQALSVIDCCRWLISLTHDSLGASLSTHANFIASGHACCYSYSLILDFWLDFLCLIFFIFNWTIKKTTKWYKNIFQEEILCELVNYNRLYIHICMCVFAYCWVNHLVKNYPICVHMYHNC